MKEPDRMVYRIRIIDSKDISHCVNMIREALPNSFMDTAERHKSAFKEGKILRVIYEERIGSRPHARAFPERLKPLLQEVYFPQARCEGNFIEVKILLR